ncbi:hypothetical protein ACA910_018038 [Epithemia clementina (nom. ined.)]
MSNLSGYCDYDGPSCILSAEQQEQYDFDCRNGDHLPSPRSLTTAATTTTTITTTIPSNNDDDDHHKNDVEEQEDEHNPLQVGFWMDGDSLAPPCGTSISTIHALLQFGHVQSQDVLYDLGCGDGRICFEAWALCQCRTIVGVEIEDDLVAKFQRIRQKLLLLQTNNSNNKEDDTKEPNGPTTPGIAAAPLPRVLQQDLRQVLNQLVQQALSLSSSLSSTNKEHGSFNKSNKNDIENGHDNKENDNDTDHHHQDNDWLPLPTILVLYLLPEAIQEIQPLLMQLLQHLPSENNVRILCNTWGLISSSKNDDTNTTTTVTVTTPVQTCDILEPGGTTSTTLFLYTKESLSLHHDDHD